MIIAEILAGLLLLCVLVPASVFFLQVLAALIPERKRAAAPGARSTVAVLVPAHDEAIVIRDALRPICAQLDKEDRVLVIADNCSDDTAAIAAAAGAMVIVRQDPTRIGKSYALEYGIRHLQPTPPGIVVVVDADCKLAEGALDRLARACDEGGRPTQALYLMHAPAGSALNCQIASFAWIVKNWVRPLGMRRLGLPCQLMGSGMAFPWRQIADARMPHEEIAEDYKLGLVLALSGHPPMFCPEALVTSHFASTRSAEATQRRRWEHGHLHLILRETPRLLYTTVVRRSPGTLGLSLDLMVPPLSLLALILALALASSLLLAVFANIVWPLGLCAIASVLFGAAVAVAWLKWGRDAVSFASLLSIPGYVLRKLPLYARFFTNRQKSWVKTRRDGS